MISISISGTKVQPQGRFLEMLLVTAEVALAARNQHSTQNDKVWSGTECKQSRYYLIALE